MWQDETPLTRIKFVEAVRDALTTANVPAKDFAGHSFRIGATTTATLDGGFTYPDPRKCSILALCETGSTSLSKTLSNAPL